MANDRMLIRCDACGRAVIIAKTMDWISWDVPEYSVTVQRKLDRFFDKHKLCLDPSGELVHDHFSLVYEIRDKFKIDYELCEELDAERRKNADERGLK